MCRLRQIHWMIIRCCRAASGSPRGRMGHGNLPGWPIRPTPASLSPVQWRRCEASAADDGTDQSMFTARPDINVLAQVLQGLRRMA